MLSAVKFGFIKYFDFAGRASRSEYWYWVLFIVLVSVLLIMWDTSYYRYVASEKLEIIRLVEESHLSSRLTLAKLGIPRCPSSEFLAPLAA